VFDIEKFGIFPCNSQASISIASDPLIDCYGHDFTFLVPAMFDQKVQGDNAVFATRNCHGNPLAWGDELVLGYGATKLTLNAFDKASVAEQRARVATIVNCPPAAKGTPEQAHPL
jgi:hypothetical protein